MFKLLEIDLATLSDAELNSVIAVLEENRAVPHKRAAKTKKEAARLSGKATKGIDISDLL